MEIAMVQAVEESR